jgi:ribose transport system ATP-binding protein
MDEPTAALTHEETLRLFAIIRDLKRRHTGVIYISHDLEEIFEIADRVTVLRDGRRVRTLPVAEATRSALIRMMIGRDIEKPGERAAARQDVVLSVRGLRRGAVLDGVSFEVRAGEIVGIAGLVGSGRTELLRATFGADRIDAGEMWFGGVPYSPRSPADAIRAGVGFVPEDRKSEGLVPEFTVSENLSLPNFGWLSAWCSRSKSSLPSRVGAPIISAGATSRRSCWPNGWRTRRSCCSWTSRPTAWTSARARRSTA